MAQPRKKVTAKLKLSDLIGGKGKANADLYKDDPKRRKHHIKHRAPRYGLITPKGSEYTRPLAGDAAKDMKLNELAREWINNGLNKVKAVAAVYGVSPKTARQISYMRLFDSSHFRSKALQMLQGVDGKFVEPAKQYAVQRLMYVIEMNILDYVDNDGSWLTVPELKALPREMQNMLEGFDMVNTARPMALTDGEGNVAHNAAGDVVTVEVRTQRVRLKLPDKTANMKLLAQILEWLDTHGDTYIIAGDVMIQAETRAKELHRNADDIESTVKRVATE